MHLARESPHGGIEHLRFNPYGNCNPTFLVSANVLLPVDSFSRRTNSPRNQETLPPAANNTQTDLLSTLELTYALSAQLAEAAGRKQSEDATCTKILAEYNTLKGLRGCLKSFER